MHGLVPPHPGPLIAVSALKADLGQTIGYGILIAIPTVIVAGPLYGMWIGRRVAPEPPARLVEQFEHSPGPLGSGRGNPVVAGGNGPALAAEEGAVLTDREPRSAPARPVETAPGAAPETAPSFGVTLATILLPVVLMLAKALGDVLITGKTRSSPRWTSSATRCWP